MEKKRRLSYRNGQGIRKQYYEKAELAEKFSTGVIILFEFVKIFL